MSKSEYQVHLYCSDTDREILWPYSGHKNGETSSVSAPCEWWLTHPVGQRWVRRFRIPEKPYGHVLKYIFFGGGQNGSVGEGACFQDCLMTSV